AGRIDERLLGNDGKLRSGLGEARTEEGGVALIDVGTNRAERSDTANSSVDRVASVGPSDPRNIREA
ncbi:MAG: hypothetical protein ACOC0J_01395, partial [Myxococcota bacterium]